MLLLQDVQVLAVGQTTLTDPSLRQGAPAAPVPDSPAGAAAQRPNAPVAQPTSVSHAALVFPAADQDLTLAVDPEAAERLALAEDYGHLRYIVRPQPSATSPRWCRPT